MNLLKALEQLNHHLDHFKAGYGITDTVAIQKLADIWDEFAATRKKEIYGSEDVVIPRTKTSCASCIKDMMNLLYNWREIVKREQAVHLVDFKAVKPAKVETVVPQSKDLSEDEKIKNAKAKLDALGVKYHWKSKIETLEQLIAQHESKQSV